MEDDWLQEAPPLNDPYSQALEAADEINLWRQQAADIESQNQTEKETQ